MCSNFALFLSRFYWQKKPKTPARRHFPQAESDFQLIDALTRHVNISRNGSLLSSDSDA
jgi:hypothetical protein